MIETLNIIYLIRWFLDVLLKCTINKKVWLNRKYSTIPRPCSIDSLLLIRFIWINITNKIIFYGFCWMILFLCWHDWKFWYDDEVYEKQQSLYAIKVLRLSDEDHPFWLKKHLVFYWKLTTIGKFILRLDWNWYS